jgi:hypothetical protein
VETHKFSHNTKEIFAKIVSKKDHGDRFWDSEDVLLVDFLGPGSTIN